MVEGRNLEERGCKKAKERRRILLRGAGWYDESTDSGVGDIGMKY